MRNVCHTLHTFIDGWPPYADDVETSAVVVEIHPENSTIVKWQCIKRVVGVREGLRKPRAPNKNESSFLFLGFCQLFLFRNFRPCVLLCSVEMAGGGVTLPPL